MVFVQDKNVYTEYTLDDMNIVNEFIKESISKLDNVSNNELKDNMYDTNKLMNSQIVFLNTIEARGYKITKKVLSDYLEFHKKTVYIIERNNCRLDIEENAMTRNERYIRKEDNKFVNLSVADYELAKKINELIDEINKLKEKYK